MRNIIKEHSYDDLFHYKIMHPLMEINEFEENPSNGDENRDETHTLQQFLHLVKTSIHEVRRSLICIKHEMDYFEKDQNQTLQQCPIHIIDFYIEKILEFVSITYEKSKDNEINLHQTIDIVNTHTNCFIGVVSFLQKIVINKIEG